MEWERYIVLLMVVALPVVFALLLHLGVIKVAKNKIKPKAHETNDDVTIVTVMGSMDSSSSSSSSDSGV